MIATSKKIDKRPLKSYTENKKISVFPSEKKHD